MRGQLNVKFQLILFHIVYIIFMAQQHPGGHGPLIIEASRSPNTF